MTSFRDGSSCERFPRRRPPSREVDRVKQQHATRLLNEAAAGEVPAAAQLIPLVYDELRRLAAAYMHDERTEHTLEPTALVHEAFVRLVDQTAIEWRSRNQFFLVAAKVMRNVLVDHARARGRLKRGGDRERLTLDAVERSVAASATEGAEGVDLLRLHQLLERLAEQDERKARLVELRFFGGFGLDEAAAIVGVARSTASEEWRLARAWLHRELRKGDPHGP